MALKTFIAATCAAALAGSMIYFSSPSQENGGSVKLTASEPVVAAGDISAEDKAEKSFIKRYLGTGNLSPNEVKETPEAGPDNPYEAEVEVIAAQANQDEESEFAATQEGMVQQGYITTTTRPTGPSTQNRTVNASPVVVTEPSNIPTLTDNTQPKKVSPFQSRINVAFEQAKKIEQSDLRDRAYLDLSDYAGRYGLFDEAKKAALKIQQVELRDTARSRIAMGMAEQGMANEAFALIEDVEVGELKDVMRLHVIEALLGITARR